MTSLIKLSSSCVPVNRCTVCIFILVSVDNENVNLLTEVWEGRKGKGGEGGLKGQRHPYLIYTLKYNVLQWSTKVEIQTHPI